MVEKLSSPISKIMSTPVVYLEATETLQDYVEKVFETGLRRFPVVLGERVEGIITAYDFIKRLHTEPDISILGQSISKIMVEKPVTVSTDTSILEAISLFVKKNVGCLIVVDENDSLVGFISERDFLWHDFIWEGVPSEFVDIDEGIGIKITKEFFITRDFSIWQVTDRMVNIDQRVLFIGDGETLYASSIVSSVDIINGIAKNKREIQEDPDYFMNAWKAFPTHSVKGLPVPQTTTALRRWMGTRGFGAFPLFYRGKSVKLIDETILVHYLGEKIRV